MKSKTSHAQPAAAEAYGSTVGEAIKSLSDLSLPLPALSALQSDYVKEATELWNRIVSPAKGEAPAALDDKRFADPSWSTNPSAAFSAQLYLLNARTLAKMADSVEGEEKTRQRLRFAVQQWVAAASPSNYLPLNPEAMNLALKTQGESISQGLQHLWQDLQQGHMSQTDESVFEVGRNVATTEGSVVFENDLFQLLEYKPLTKTVFERPLLMVPPCINKYYILDLQPENSLIRHAVSQGHRVFVMSWRNADEDVAQKTWDDYIDHAAIKAINVVREITGAKTINTLGFCVG
ncbi:MAG TPA: alpha/beta fold hydrolase, partial [Rhizobacter sp.]|nr:alpha/beta fold hydrolase [Rhizobacter sp.]